MGEVDPIWNYTYDAAGAVISVRAFIPAFALGPVTVGAMESTQCYTYDPEHRMTSIDVVLSSLGMTNPCTSSSGLAQSNLPSLSAM